MIRFASLGRGTAMKKFTYASILASLWVALPGIAQESLTRYATLAVSSDTSIPYAVHLPDGFDPEQTYAVLIGPGDGEEGTEAGFYWRTDPHSHGWIIIDAQLWEADTRQNLGELLGAIANDYKVEGGKFHAVCWSANSAGIFRLVTDNAEYFHSITGMAGNPSKVSDGDIEALQNVKVQFVVGQNDGSWQRSTKAAYDKYRAGGIDTVYEIVPGAGHVMMELVGKGFVQKLEKLR